MRFLAGCGLARSTAATRTSPDGTSVSAAAFSAALFSLQKLSSEEYFALLTDGQLVYDDQPGLKSSAGETFDAIGTEALPVMPQKEDVEAKL